MKSPARLLVVANDVVGPTMAGPGIRAWEIARAVARAGHVVTVAAPGSGPPRRPGDHAPTPGADVAPVTDVDGPPPAVRLVHYDPAGDALRAAASEADALLVQSLVLAHYPFLATLTTPLVVDLYDPFALENLPGGEAAAASTRSRRHDGDLAALCGLLARGDFFLCASETQRDLWIGALLAEGRVNPRTYDADVTLRGLIDVVPFGLPEEDPQPGAPLLKGVVDGIGVADEVLLWGGGLWNWFDPALLVRAVDRLARERPTVRLVFLGTRSPSPYVREAPRAVEARRAAEERGLVDRVVFFRPGWLPYAERGRALLEADVGVSTHRPQIEARYAFRTRLLDYIWAGLPMVVTAGDVVAELVVARGLGLAVPAGDEDALVEALNQVLDAAADPPRRRAMAATSRALRAELTWDRAVAPLVRFLADPASAPDEPWRLAPPAAPTTAPRDLPGRALEVVRDEGVLALFEETARYLRWRRRPR